MNDEVIRPRTCPVCFGRGRDFRFGEPCERCNGTGHVFDDQPDDHIPSIESAILQAELAALRQQVAVCVKALEEIEKTATTINDEALTYFEVDEALTNISERARTALEAAKNGQKS